MGEKKFEVFKGNSDNKEIVTLSQIKKLMLSGGFMTMLEHCSKGEILFHNDTMREFKRIE